MTFIFDPDLCTGCMHCMTACATHHEGSTSLSKARLKIIRHEGQTPMKGGGQDDVVFRLLSCQQCEEPICSTVCPLTNVRRDAATGALTIDRTKCVGCRMCLMTCYFGAISFDQKKKQSFKCELCGGDPECVKFCRPGALKFVPIEQAALRKKKKAATAMTFAPIEKQHR